MFALYLIHYKMEARAVDLYFFKPLIFGFSIKTL